MFCSKIQEISHKLFFLARQISPYNNNIVVEAFLDATKNPHSYLMFDFLQSTEDTHRMRTEIFPGEDDFIYVKKDVDIKGLTHENEVHFLERWLA